MMISGFRERSMVSTCLFVSADRPHLTMVKLEQVKSVKCERSGIKNKGRGGLGNILKEIRNSEGTNSCGS